jgi:hypothetical protein
MAHVSPPSPGEPVLPAGEPPPLEITLLVSASVMRSRIMTVRKESVIFLIMVRDFFIDDKLN